MFRVALLTIFAFLVTTHSLANAQQIFCFRYTGQNCDCPYTPASNYACVPNQFTQSCSYAFEAFGPWTAYGVEQVSQAYPNGAPLIAFAGTRVCYQFRICSFYNPWGAIAGTCVDTGAVSSFGCNFPTGSLSSQSVCQAEPEQ
jgi:hypothetical protein